jgi:hypothetical protein
MRAKGAPAGSAPWRGRVGCQTVGANETAMTDDDDDDDDDDKRTPVGWRNPTTPGPQGLRAASPESDGRGIWHQASGIWAGGGSTSPACSNLTARRPVVHDMHAGAPFNTISWKTSIGR